MKWSKIKPGETWEMAPGVYVCRSARQSRNFSCLNCPPDFDPRPVTGPNANPSDEAAFRTRLQTAADEARAARAVIGGAA